MSTPLGTQEHEAPNPLYAEEITGENFEASKDLEKATKVDSTRSTQTIEFPPSIWGSLPGELALFVFIGGLASQVSTLAIPSFFSIIPTLSDKFDTSIESINLTATIYSIFQGIAPIFWGGLSDTYGRRPVYICCIAIAIAANYALANIASYGSLFGLRIVQAFGGASTVSLLSAVVGDITERKNRGGISATATGIQSLGTCFGPLIGGALTQRWGWPATFYFLGSHAVLCLILILFLFPETNRHIAGDGSLMPRNFVYKSVYASLRRRFTGVPYSPNDPQYSNQWLPPPHKASFFRWLYLLRQIDVILVLIPNALTYTTWYMVLTSMSTNLTNSEHFNSLQVGCCYLSSAFGTIVAVVLSGRAMNWNFRRRVRNLQEECAKKGIEYSPRDLNIYRTRLELSIWAMIICCIGTFVYGWTFHFHVTFYVPVVMTCLVSFGSNCFLSISTVILVDLFPDDSAASTSCVNLTRCLICAAGMAAVDKMQQNMTIGGTYTFLTAICGISWLCIWVEIKMGGRFASRRKSLEHHRAAK